MSDNRPRDPSSLDRWLIERDLDLYKFYLDLVLRVSGAMALFLGGAGSFYLASDKEGSVALYLLVFVLALSLVLGIILLAFSVDAWILRKRHFWLTRERLDLQHNWELAPLPVFLWFSGLAFIAVGVVGAIVIVSDRTG